jgi:hypothetical protein
MPPAALSRNGRSRSVISGNPCSLAIAAAVATLWTTKPVSGGELKFVVSRSMLPCGLCARSRKPAARSRRSTSARSL